ncbi:MAG: hypothetical protein ABSG52_13295 [Terriglobales bacterium]
MNHCSRFIFSVVAALLLTTISLQAQNPVTTPGGSTNKLPKFTSSTTVSDSSIYDNGNVGIGTTSPAFNLDVLGGIQTQSTSFPQINFKQTGSVAQEYRHQINTDGSYRIYDMTAGTVPRFVLTQTGNVGIGTATPGFSLDVVGGIRSQLGSFPQITFTQTGAPGFVVQEYRHQINADGSYRIYDMTAGAVPRFTLTQSGYVGIGTTNPQYPLSVNGTIQAKEVIVNTGWSDYVFGPDYRVRPLTEVAAFIKANHHLPDIPSEAEVKQNGVSLGEMQAKLLAKIEELTLQMIHLNEKNRALEKKVAQLEQR